ncbi:MAG: hypothetical protein A4E57_03096 [Syntrophorhabdaceae bacterium PtaU1.Bin034]|jgi:hypothetical protein|nr:MAG: hypothetical protein A4E57_03096 [Syntrophorhabdaceae bacterium PtaU1.Bin034]
MEEESLQEHSGEEVTYKASVNLLLKVFHNYHMKEPFG